MTLALMDSTWPPAEPHQTSEGAMYSEMSLEQDVPVCQPP